MAPERFESEDRSRVSPAADIFSWGAVVAYAATGRTPFGADSAPGTAVRIMTQPPDLTGLPAALREPVSRALAKQPHDRPTARELLDLLLAAAPSGQPVRASHETPFLREIVQAADRTPVEPMPRPLPPRYRLDTGRRRSRRPDLRRWPARAGIAGLATAMLAGGLASRALLTDRDADAARSPEVTVATTDAAAQRTEGADPTAAILAGQRRVVLHIADSSRNLAVQSGGRAGVSTEAGADTEFRLIPRDGSYLVRSLRPALDPAEACLGVDKPADGTSPLAAASCSDSPAVLFDLAPSGERDKENRVTYRLRNRAHGVVQWSDDRFAIFVEQAADDPADTTFSLVDAGPA
jgi:hypothetical protein